MLMLALIVAITISVLASLPSVSPAHILGALQEAQRCVNGVARPVQLNRKPTEESQNNTLKNWLITYFDTLRVIAALPEPPTWG